jgi:isocitrate/isopropylmalate dehydrogenase
MMLKHLGELESANLVENSLLKVLKEGKVLTPDLGGSSKTMEMTREVIKNINI